MIQKTRLQKLIIKALGYITSLSIDDIVSANSYTDLSCVNKVRESKVNFTAAFVLHSLSYVPVALSNRKLEGLRVSLIDQFKRNTERFSFNYYLNDKENSFTLIDDVDDTAVCLSALIRNKVEINPKFILKLINIETAPGGPYKTWYAPATSNDIWKDVDPVVNAHVLYLTSLLKVKLPKTLSYLHNEIKNNRIASPYYPFDLIFYFYFARYVHESNDAVSKEIIINKLNDINFKKLSNIEKLLFALTKSYLNENIEDDVLDKVLKMQNRDGSLDEMPFCFDYKFRGDKAYATNKALITSLWVELLLLLNKDKSPTIGRQDSQLKELTASVMENINLETELSSIGHEMVTRFMLPSKAKPILISAAISLDIKPKLNKKEFGLLTSFTIAAYFGWIGYAVIDGIIDGQLNNVDYIGANFAMRNLFKYIYANFNFDKKTELEILKAWDTTDQSYVWEYNNARFKVKKTTAEYDYMHITKRMDIFLTFLKFLPEMIFDIHDEKLSNIIYKVLCNIMIIDQLNDDLHDWEEDMTNGILTYITFNILNKEKIEPLKDRMYKNVMPSVLELCNKLYIEAKELIQSFSDYKLNNLLNVLDSSYSPIKTAIEEMDKAKDILKYYER